MFNRKGLKLALSESCTGGWLAKIITEILSGSAWFIGAVVSYSNEAQKSLLGVNKGTLSELGAGNVRWSIFYKPIPTWS